MAGSFYSIEYAKIRSTRNLSIEKAKIIYNWDVLQRKSQAKVGQGFIQQKKPKYGTAGDLIGKTSQNKLRMGIYFIGNAVVRHIWGFNSLKSPK